MTDTMRWRYGDTNPVVTKPVAAGVAIEIGDLVAQDSSGNVTPASSATWTTDLATTQGAFHAAFLGVAMQRSLGSDNGTIRVATTGVFEMDCAAATFNVGDLVAPAQGTGNVLASQSVAAARQRQRKPGDRPRGGIRQSRRHQRAGLDRQHHDAGWAAGRALIGGPSKVDVHFFNQPPSQLAGDPIVVKVREIKRMYELGGADRALAELSNALAKKAVRAEDFSLRALAEGLIPDGREWLNSLDPRRGGFVQEAGDAVDVTAFSNITGQIIYTKIMEAYQREEFVVSRLVSTIPTRFDGEKIAGIAGLVDDTAEIRPGMPYQPVENWVFTLRARNARAEAEDVPRCAGRPSLAHTTTPSTRRPIREDTQARQGRLPSASPAACPCRRVCA